jgi:hypothetical protein
LNAKEEEIEQLKTSLDENETKVNYMKIFFD